MKLIIQIPCFNEEETLNIALSALPREIPGIDKIEVLVIDDGSKDGTVRKAHECGVDYVVEHHRNRGLAAAFMTGLHACLERGADIIVNTDADNQYCADDIPKLLEPILSKRAEYVIGTRPIQDIEHFSPLKKFLQKLGSKMVRRFSGTDVADAPSGFRALSRDAAMKINVFNNYTYTIETIIQAGMKGIPIECVPVRVNEELRPSRLFRSMGAYIRRSIFTMVRMHIIYNPFSFFMKTGIVFLIIGCLPGLRFLYRYFFTEHSRGMVQSLILAAILILTGVISIMMAVIGDIMAINRRLLEDIQYNQRKKNLDSSGKEE